MNIANIYELTPKYDNAQSFYGKAHIVRDVYPGESVLNLVSYDTKVASLASDLNTKKTVKVTTNPAHLTATTLRHIKEFLKQHGFKAETKKQIVKDYGAGA